MGCPATPPGGRIAGRADRWQQKFQREQRHLSFAVAGVRRPDPPASACQRRSCVHGISWLFRHDAATGCSYRSGLAAVSLSGAARPTAPGRDATVNTAFRARELSNLKIKLNKNMSVLRLA